MPHMTLQLSLLLRRPPADPATWSPCTGLKTPCFGETNCSCRSSSGSSVSGTVGSAMCFEEEEEGKQEAATLSAGS